MEEKKKLKQAVALRYDSEKDNAPIITASGQGIVAENMIKTAVENEVPVHYNEKLVKELIELKIGTEIPQEIYEIVAQVLVFVETIDQRKGSWKGSLPL